MPKAGPQLLEPIMKSGRVLTEDKVGDVIGDLNRRRMIKDQTASSAGIRGQNRRLPACLKCSELHRVTCVTMTSGRG